MDEIHLKTRIAYHHRRRDRSLQRNVRLIRRAIGRPNDNIQRVRSRLQRFETPLRRSFRLRNQERRASRFVIDRNWLAYRNWRHHFGHAQRQWI